MYYQFNQRLCENPFSAIQSSVLDSLSERLLILIKPTICVSFQYYYRFELNRTSIEYVLVIYV